MRGWVRLGLGIALVSSAHAQVDLQKFRIDRVTLNFVTNKPSTNRCLLWFPYEAQTPITQFDDDGRPFAKVKLRARVRGKDCNVSFRPQEAMKLVKQEENDLFFEVTVTPPSTIIEFNGFFNGPDFRDQLVFTAVSDSLEEIDFFTFFKKSKVFFETRWATLSTTNPEFTSKTHLLPVFGGKIGVPFPWIDRLIADFSMFQNLGNATPNKFVGVQYSEFAFGLTYLWSGKEDWGRPQIAPTVDFRGRNVYQTFVSQSKLAGRKPYLIGQLTVPGAGIEASWFPGGLWKPWEHWMSRVGIDGSYRQYFLGRIQPQGYDSLVNVGANTWEVGLQYRLTRKWAVGLGYSRQTESFDYPAPDPTDDSTPIHEKMSNIYLRLLLVPYIVEEENRL